MAEKTTTTRRRSTAKTEVQQPDVDVNELLSANEEFNQQNEKLHKENAELKERLNIQDKELGEIKTMLRSQSKMYESQEKQVGQDNAFTFDDDNTIIQASPDEIENPIGSPDKEALHRFMHEKVKIRIAENNSEHADFSFFVAVNGQKEFFHEGETKTVERKFVEGLARLKKVTYRTVKKKEDDGEDFYEYIPRTGLRHPFTVLHDPNRRGPAWLDAVLLEP